MVDVCDFRFDKRLTCLELGESSVQEGFWDRQVVGTLYTVHCVFLQTWAKCTKCAQQINVLSQAIPTPRKQPVNPHRTPAKPGDAIFATPSVRFVKADTAAVTVDIDGRPRPVRLRGLIDGG